MSKKEQETIAVILLNLGGPERLEDVEPFLLNLFSDRKIIRLGPKFMQKFIARRIVKKRAPKSRETYRLIGGGSPLARITGEQGAALEKELAATGNFKVMMAMRYWPPYAKEVLARCQEQGISRIVALTLYPHYSVATTGSSIDDLKKAAASCASPFQIAEIESWPDQPDYIESLAANVTAGVARFNGAPVELVYSAHSLPKKFIDEGDPYLDHMNRTIKALEAKTGISGRLCFQSRSGPVEWLAPSTPEMLATIAAEGIKNVLLVPISFVSDHVETLYEIDILYHDLAKELGMRLERVESLNIQLRFIAALRQLVVESCQSHGWLD
ncbi:MAG: ferrochelatase [Proteobacteria bacterium]|nr:ferrochelatase [Pseudomonadota bacterium]MBU1716173.1 ferrochelatase [Pseudomonadota bacterium]